MFSSSKFLLCAISSLYTIVGQLQIVSAKPVPDLARLLERGLPVDGIQLNKDGDKGQCLVDFSTAPNSQVGMGDCNNEGGSRWQFKGDIIEWKTGEWYWVGTIKNRERDLCLTVDDKPTPRAGRGDLQVANSASTWKVMTSECNGDAVKDRQKWMIGMSKNGEQKGNFIRPANAKVFDCSFQGISGYSSYSYWADLWPMEGDKGMVSLVCVSPDHHTLGWKTKIGDRKFGF